MIVAQLEVMPTGELHHFPKPKLATLAVTTSVQAPDPRVQPSSTMTLFGEPSLNFLSVLGGQSNSRRKGFFSEQEFLLNTVLHSLWLQTQPPSFFEAHQLNSQDQQDLSQLCQMLFQSQMIEQLFLDSNNKPFAHHLMLELAKTGHILLHNNDNNHAFFLEITKKKIDNKRNMYCDLHIYNTGKGLGFHQHPPYSSVLEKITRVPLHRKRYTCKTYVNVKLNESRLDFLTSQKRAQGSSLWTRPIYVLYLAIIAWQKKNTLSTINTPTAQTQNCSSPLLQARQKQRDCQMKSIKAVARHKLSEKCYLVWRNTLMQLSIDQAAHPQQNLQKKYNQAILNLQTKIQKAQDKLLA